MAQYLQIEFKNISIPVSELLVAQLSEIGFDGFEEDDNILKAFIPVHNFDEALLNKVAGRLDALYIKSTIEETNWNHLWESNFQPVIIEDIVHGTPWVVICAVFHKPIKGVKQEIIITPKMSFGTGHHATTSMMIQQMIEIDFAGKTVLDFGTGTGILSILAKKMGAEKVVAIDHDEWSIENAKENFQQNNCETIRLIKTDAVIPGNKFDIILANINKNVILKSIPELSGQLVSGGILIVSGLLEEDEKEILDEAAKYTLHNYQKVSQKNWICIRFEH